MNADAVPDDTATKPKPAKGNNPDGRPPVLVGGIRKNVYLDAGTIEYATTLGSGELSAGLREAVRRVRCAVSQGEQGPNE
jgi:hypothetical protein